MRRGRAAAWLALIALLMLAKPALAVRPDEVLSDPALEARARAISAELRCLVCQNQSIDDSDADLAHDLRVLVRERLKAGDSDQQAIDFIVARYGEFVLLKPRFSLRNSLLWATPVVLIAAGAIFIVTASRRRRSVAGMPLSAEEKAALEAVLSGQESSSGKA
jgi:cytochrome c-type biogenesis protein CcmH